MTDVQQWLEERRAAARLRVQRIGLSRCPEWLIHEGELRHHSGRYFQVVGMRSRDAIGGPWEQPMIRQEEVGILGFLVRSDDARVDWLGHAKTEPGTVRGTQIGPTVQATKSNYQRVHRGAETAYLDWFASGECGSVQTDVLASEHGQRFLRKRNRNVVVLASTDHAPSAGVSWRWISAHQLRSLLARDFTVNTDARSVIASAPWRLIAGGRGPFSSAGTPFAARLHDSYAAVPDVRPVLDELTAARDLASKPPTPATVPLSELTSWAVTDRGIVPVRYGDFAVVYVAVAASDREVAHWCQPLFAASQQTEYVLWCQVRYGTLRFLFRSVAQPGLVELAELDAASPVASGVGREPPATTHLSVLQSDEGGRFLYAVTRYSVVELHGEATRAKPGEHWLTLGQIEALAQQPATFTNEARSAISLVLSLA